MGEKEIVRIFYEEVITRNEENRIDDFIDENCMVRVGDEKFSMGLNGMKEHIRATKETYPDYSMKIISQYQDGNIVISEFIMTGTHKGKFAGITPTGKEISITGVDIDKVVDGKIVEHGGAANTFDAFLENNLIEPV